MNNINNIIKLNKKLILASKSPRRKKLLDNLGFVFEVIESGYKEDKTNGVSDFRKYAIDSAFNKANDVAQRQEKNCLVLGADTIVVLENEILHKPKDKADALNILRTLSNRTHEVLTGVAIIDTESNRVIENVQTTEVTFRELSDDEIQAYIESGSPMDKAGGYGIQDDFGAVFVQKINGCYYNVVGLPLEMVYTMLKEFSEIK